MTTKKPTLNDLEKQISDLEIQVRSIENEIQAEFNSYITRIHSLINVTKSLASKKWRWLLFIALLLLLIYLFFVFKKKKTDPTSYQKTSSGSQIKTWLIQSILLPILLSSIRKALPFFFSRK